jgi:hypothetical protein
MFRRILQSQVVLVVIFHNHINERGSFCFRLPGIYRQTIQGYGGFPHLIELNITIPIEHLEICL